MFAVFALIAMAFGVRDLIRTNSLVNFQVESESIKWLAIAVSYTHLTLPTKA